MITPWRAVGCAMGLAVAALLGGPAAAQEPSARPAELRDAVTRALAQNLDLSIERLSPLIARAQGREAVGAFDPILGGGVSYARTERFPNSILEQAARSGLIQENTLTAQYPSLLGRLPTGTEYSMSLTTPIVRSNNPLRLYDESYQPVLNFGVTQPLLRDFGIEINTVRVKQAAKAESLSLSAVEAKMLTVIRDVEMSYWTVFGAERHVAVARSGLDLSLDLVERTGRAREAGLATDLDLLQARAAVEARRADVARAQAELEAARARLKLVVEPGAAPAAGVAVAGTPPDDGPVADLAGTLQRALATRPEVRQQEVLIEKIALEERVAQNNTQWRLDAVGSLGWNGLAGSGVNPAARDALSGRLQGQDSYPDSFRGFFSPDGNASYSVGLRVQIPLGNNEARGRLTQVRLVRRQEELRLALLKGQIGVDVETAFHDVTARAAALVAAREGLAVARRQLDAQERDLAAGLTTARKVLEAQDGVGRAADAETQAWVDYAVARSRLDAVAAQSFDTYGLVVQR